MNRWLYSTNAKDIGIKYLIFSILSGLIGSALSFLIRIELSSGGEIYLLGSNHLYNVIITGHALLMIFYKVKPGLIGGFGTVNN
jgi:heme/copper-type cytochrome/quinol oxidase subunit 1